MIGEWYPADPALRIDKSVLRLTPPLRHFLAFGMKHEDFSVVVDLAAHPVFLGASETWDEYGSNCVPTRYRAAVGKSLIHEGGNNSQKEST